MHQQSTNVRPRWACPSGALIGGLQAGTPLVDESPFLAHQSSLRWDEPCGGGRLDGRRYLADQSSLRWGEPGGGGAVSAWEMERLTYFFRRAIWPAWYRLCWMTPCSMP